MKNHHYWPLVLAAALPCLGHAAGLQWYYENASGLGNAYSGEAAIADDASTEYFNPAGLTRFDHQQFVAGIVGTRYSNHFNGKTNDSASATTLTGAAFSQALVPWPFFYYVKPLSNRFALGVGLSSPFGIGADFPTSSIVRYNGTSFNFIDINLSVSLAYKILNNFSAGLGADINRLAVNDNLMFSTTSGTDAKSLNHAVDWGHGWHAGLLYAITESSRVGLAYHSRIIMHPHGKSEFVITPGANVGNEIISNNFKFTYYLPPSTALSAYHDINNKWALLGTLDYTQWSVQKHLALHNIAFNTGTTSAPVASVIPNNIPNGYKNTFRLALGTNYKFNPKWMLRLGAAFEQDPSNNVDRSANDPSSGSTSLAIGAHYQAMKCMGIDIGYQHFFMREGSINMNNSNGYQHGAGKLHQDSLGLQGTWDL